jgi:hypothetical protein
LGKLEINKFEKLNIKIESIILEGQEITSQTLINQQKIFGDILYLLDRALLFKKSEFEDWKIFNLNSPSFTGIDIPYFVGLLEQFNSWFRSNDELYNDHLKSLQYYYQKEGLPTPNHWLEVFTVDIINETSKSLTSKDLLVTKELIVEASLRIKSKIDLIIKNSIQEKNKTVEPQSLINADTIGSIQNTYISNKLALMKELGMLDAFLERLKRGNPSLNNVDKAKILCGILDLDVEKAIDTVRICLSSHDTKSNRNYLLGTNAKKFISNILTPLSIKLEGDYKVKKDKN